MVASSCFLIFTKYYTVMISFESILDFLKNNLWTILTRVAILGALFVYIRYYMKNTIEGFEIKDGVIPLDKMYVCPTIKDNLAHNSAILDEHIQFNRVVSEESTRKVIEAFTQSYQANECDEYFANPDNPRTAPRMFPEPLYTIEQRLKKEKEDQVKSENEKSEKDTE